MNKKLAIGYAIFLSVGVVGVSLTTWFLETYLGSGAALTYVGFIVFGLVASWFAPAIRRWME